MTAAEAKAKYQLGTAQAKNNGKKHFSMALGLGSDNLVDESDDELEGQMKVGDDDSASGMSGVM